MRKERIRCSCDHVSNLISVQMVKLRTVKSLVITARIHTNFRPGSSQIAFGRAAGSRERSAVVRKKEKEKVGACSKEEMKGEKKQRN